LIVHQTKQACAVTTPQTIANKTEMSLRVAGKDVWGNPRQVPNLATFCLTVSTTRITLMCPKIYVMNMEKLHTASAWRFDIRPVQPSCSRKFTSMQIHKKGPLLAFALFMTK